MAALDALKHWPPGDEIAGQVDSILVGAHINRQNPHRTLRGVEVKRRLIDEHAAERYEYPRQGGEPIGEPHCHSCVTDRDQYEPDPDAFPCLTLRLLALEWSTHEDYRSEWA